MQKIKFLIVFFVLLIPAISWLLQPGFFPMHDDLQPMRQLELEKCLKDGQFPCRWVLDMGYGYGYPLFNFYPPLPYFVGQIFRTFGLTFVDTVKVVGVLGFVVSAWGMYLLGKEFWGKKGGLISSVIFTYAPYHSVDFYVRAAVNEFWAMGFFAFVFWTTYKLIYLSSNPSPKLGEGNGVRYIPLVALSVTGIMLSHNPTLMIFAPFYLLWIVICWFKKRSLKSFWPLVIAGIWSLGMAAFFTLPVVFEQKYAHVETLVIGYFNYLAHFLDINQMFFKINWGYGSSVLGPDDTMSFAIGYLQWILPLVIILTTPFVKKLRENWLIVLFLVFSFMFSVIMMHWKATPIWQLIKPLEFLQFPWRLLTLSVFFAAFVSGSIVSLSKKLVPILLMLVLLLNANYFRPREWWPDYIDKDRFSGRQWQLMTTSGIFDYLPIYAPMPPADPPGGDVSILNGLGRFEKIEKRSNFQAYKIEIASPNAVVELQTFYFPGWKVWLDGVEKVIDPKQDPVLGRIRVDVPFGTHFVEARFGDTPIRVLGNLFSLFAWGVMIIYTGLLCKKKIWS